jgi:hypothetical protein
LAESLTIVIIPTDSMWVIHNESITTFGQLILNSYEKIKCISFRSTPRPSYFNQIIFPSFDMGGSGIG